MTIKEFLSLPEEEQAIEASKVLTPGLWKHDITNVAHSTGACWCSKCKEWIIARSADDFNKCPVPDPLTIDWETAKRLQGECELYEFTQAGWEVSNEADPDNTILEWWLLNKADPIHYIAACMVAEGKLE